MRDTLINKEHTEKAKKNVGVKYLPLQVLIALIVLFCLMNLPIMATLWRHGFDDGTYSHSILIPFIVIFLYKKLNDIGKLTFNSNLNSKGTVLVFLFSICLYVSSNAQISLIYWLSAYILLISIIFILYKFNFYIIFPVSYFIFIIPLWGELSTLLQTISVTAVTYLMSFTSIPIYVESRFVSIPAGTFEIANGCSGLRYLIVSLAISSLFIFLYIKSVKRALVFLFVAILGALITNWIRITLLILIGHETDMTHSLMNDHNNFGWYIYAPFMILLYMFGNKLVDIDLFEEKQIKQENNKINNNNIIIVIIALCISSTTLYGFIKAENKISEKVEITYQPEIKHYHTVTKIQEDMHDNSYTLRYTYTGADLDEKPTYYENNYIPSGWFVWKEKSNNQWKRFLVVNKSQYAIVSYRYKLEDLITTSRRELKLARLMTLSPFKQPELEWQFTLCQQGCQLEWDNIE